MSLDLQLVEADECLFEINLTYNYSGMWALAMGHPGKEHDPPKSFLHTAPEDRVKMVEIEGLTGQVSQAILHRGLTAMLSNIIPYRALNPSNGWGSADMLFDGLQLCLKAAQENPDAVWGARR